MRRRVVVLIMVLACCLLAAAPLMAQKAVSFSWWHLGVNEPDKSTLQSIADEYMKLHPNVTINITILENEAFKAKLTTVMQSGDPPDLFNTWGGGLMREYAKAGNLRDLTREVKGTAWGNSMPSGVLGVYQADGKQFGVPFDAGAVTIYYNKDLLAKVGSKSFPATWADMLKLVQKLKDAGITPIALGAGDKWPSHFWWSYLAIRLGGRPAFENVINGKGSFNDEPFVKAGQMLLDLANMKPFQEGFLAATWPDQAGTIGDGKAAFHLMGQWSPTAEAGYSVSKKGILDKEGLAAFPSVPGGKGLPTDVFGGGNGIAVGKNAPDEAVDFLRFFTNKENNSKYAATGSIIPVTKGAESAIPNPNAKLVKALVDKGTYYQLYLDQFFAPAVGGVVNDSVQTILAGTASPAEAAAAIQRAFDANK
ncbi:MAG TPA: extracellular solute-binding protein [Spirochaetia bacterium]|nr:extracellular solute-binding protein [Spirochaetia bacterium]